MHGATNPVSFLLAGIFRDDHRNVPLQNAFELPRRVTIGRACAADASVDRR